MNDSWKSWWRDTPATTWSAGPRRPAAADPHPPRPIEGVIFELCGVLYDDSAWRRWLLHLVSHMGLHTHYAAFFRVWERDYQPDVWQGKAEFWTSLKRFLRTAGLSRGQVDEVEAASRARFRDLAQDIRPFPCVVATLAQLARGGLELTVMTRVPLGQFEMAGKLATLGMSRQIRHLVPHDDARPSGDHHHRFRNAIAATRRPAERLAYVGCDSCELRTARELDLLTVAFNHDADAVADHYVEQFDQLCELLDGTRPLLAAG